jgi:hypothetical protein
LDNIIEYCGTYYGIPHGGLKFMFIDLAYLQLDDGVFDDEDYNQCWIDEVDIVDTGGLATMDEDGHCDDVNVLKGLFVPIN